MEPAADWPLTSDEPVVLVAAVGGALLGGVEVVPVEPAPVVSVELAGGVFTSEPVVPVAEPVVPVVEPAVPVVDEPVAPGVLEVGAWVLMSEPVVLVPVVELGVWVLISPVVPVVEPVVPVAPAVPVVLVLGVCVLMSPVAVPVVPAVPVVLGFDTPVWSVAVVPVVEEVPVEVWPVWSVLALVPVVEFCPLVRSGFVLPGVVAFWSVVLLVVPVPVAVELCAELVPAVCAVAKPIAKNRVPVIRIPFFM